MSLYHQQTYALTKVDGLGSVSIKKIFEQFGNSPEVVFQSLKKTLGINKYSQFLNELGQLKKSYDKLLASSKAVGIWEDIYPKTLKLANDSPPLFFYRSKNDIGDLAEKLSKSIAVVGTRSMSGEGQYLSKKLARQLSRYDVPLISGMAFGVDAVALKTIVEENGLAIAVIPGNVNIATPKGNSHIYQDIIGSGGFIVSESLEYEINSYDFPKRNRIIAGLAAATVVVQATYKSGANITAKQAFSYGRQVFAYPGSVSDAGFAGNNKLIKYNIAQAITSANDLIDFLNIEEKIEVSTEAHSKTVSDRKMGALANKIISVIRFGPIDLDSLCAKIDSESNTIVSLLVELELQDLIYFDKSVKKYKIAN